MAARIGATFGVIWEPQLRRSPAVVPTTRGLSLSDASAMLSDSARVRDAFMTAAVNARHFFTALAWTIEARGEGCLALLCRRLRGRESAGAGSRRRVRRLGGAGRRSHD